MNQNIEFYSKNVYGDWKMYIKDAVMQANMQALTGTKKLTESDKKSWEDLGFTFTEVIAPR